MIRWFLCPVIHQDYDFVGGNSNRPALASLVDKQVNVYNKAGKVTGTTSVKDQEYLPGCSWSAVYNEGETSCLVRVEAPDLSFIDAAKLTSLGVIYQEQDSKEKVETTAVLSPWTKEKWEGAELETTFGVAVTAEATK